MNENREVIIPGVSGVLRFLADGINSIPGDNNIPGAMKETLKRYSIAKGRIQNIPLAELIEDTGMQIEQNDNKQTKVKPAPKSRLYDDLGLGDR
ncbi:MAG: hypothetical protein U0N02_06630 [Clostridia bacterium]